MITKGCVPFMWTGATWGSHLGTYIFGRKPLGDVHFWHILFQGYRAELCAICFSYPPDMYLLVAHTL